MAQLGKALVLSTNPDIMERLNEEGIKFDKLQERSDSLSGGEIVGAVLRWSRGDGYAYYLVTNDSPPTLRHISFGDEWRVEPALIRGLRKQDILDMLESYRWFQSLGER